MVASKFCLGRAGECKIPPPAVRKSSLGEKGGLKGRGRKFIHRVCGNRHLFDVRVLFAVLEEAGVMDPVVLVFHGFRVAGSNSPVAKNTILTRGRLDLAFHNVATPIPRMVLGIFGLSFLQTPSRAYRRTFFLRFQILL